MEYELYMSKWEKQFMKIKINSMSYCSKFKTQTKIYKHHFECTHDIKDARTNIGSPNSPESCH